MKRYVKVKGEDIYVELEATDVLSKEDYIQLYDGRVQEKGKLEAQMTQYKEQISKVEEFEDDEDIKKVVKRAEKDNEFSQQLFAVMQKKMLAEQIQIWEKALMAMEQELKDLTPTYQKIKEDKDGNDK